MTQPVTIVLLVVAVLVAAYGWLGPRYQIVAPDSRYMYRLDTRTGAVSYFELTYDRDEIHERARTSE